MKNDADVSEHERGSGSMRELTTQTGIVVKCSKTAIEFSKMLSQWISFCAGDPRGIPRYSG